MAVSLYSASLTCLKTVPQKQGLKWDTYVCSILKESSEEKLVRSQGSRIEQGKKRISVHLDCLVVSV